MQQPSVDGADAESTKFEAKASAKAAPDERTTASSPETPLQLRAEQGDAEDQYNLGVAYDTGRSVPDDYVQAYAWLNLAAAQGMERAEQMKTPLRQ